VGLGGLNGTAIDHVMLCMRDDFGCLSGSPRASGDLCVCYYRRANGEDSDAFGKRRTFEESGDLVADSPSLMGENNGVHEFLGPRIFNLKCLLIFHGL